MKLTVLTFGGRKKFLEILFSYIEKYEKYIDEYRIYVSTENQEDIDYMIDFANKKNYVKLIRREYPDHNLWNQSYKDCQDDNTVYLKIDDDILYIDETLFTDFIKFRIDNPKYPIIYPMIINNVYTSWVLQEKMGMSFNGVTDYGYEWPKYVGLIKDHLIKNGIPERIDFIIPSNKIMCDVSWGSVPFAISVHDKFLTDLNNNDIIKYKRTTNGDVGLEIVDNNPMSIQCISWLGSSLKEYTTKFGDVWQDEIWLSVYLPILTGQNNFVYLDSVVSHYSYYIQMERGILHTNILDRYKQFSEKN